MKEKELNQLKSVLEKLESIFNYDNKNLLLRQYYKLDDVIITLKEMIKSEEEKRK